MPSNYCLLQIRISNVIFEKMHSHITFVDTHARAPRGGFFTGILELEKTIDRATVTSKSDYL